MNDVRSITLDSLLRRLEEVLGPDSLLIAAFTKVSDLRTSVV